MTKDMGSTLSEIAALKSEALFDKDNQEQVYAYKMIAKTHNSFFLTGRAGTGKTSFLKYVQKNIRKIFVVLAPTGSASAATTSFLDKDFEVRLTRIIPALDSANNTNNNPKLLR